MRNRSLLALLLAACGSPSVTPPPPAAPATAAPSPAGRLTEPATVARTPEVLAENADRVTPAGATFTAPGGWTATPLEQGVALAPPEPNLQMFVVDVPGADPNAAVERAWKAARGAYTRPVKLTQPSPGRDGWDAAHDVTYETSPSEKRVVFAVAYKKDDRWSVVLVDADQAAFERRVAGVRLVLQSLRPKGYKRESFAGKKPHPLDAPRIKELTDFVEWARVEAGVPGVAIALVQGDKVVFQGGFGVRELGKKTPVDEGTLFMIASNTKSLTTLMLATLVDEGKLQWTTPVASLLPEFKLGDPAVTAQVQVKHLVCACTGLPRQDFEWIFEFKDATPKTTLASLGTMVPTTKFGETYQYSNPLASAGGYVGGHVAYPDKELGAAYDAAMKARVFGPLGMRSTTFDFATVLRQNHATPHGEDIDGVPRVAPMGPNYAIVPIRPAGGAWSNVRDLARVVQMELANGKIPGGDGKRLVSEASIAARRAPQVSFGERQTYGMGLEVDRTWDLPWVHHGGSMIGFKSDYFFIPEHGIGGVILTNADAGYMLLRPFVRRTLEVLFDGRPEAKEDVATVAKARKAQLRKERERLVVPPDPSAVSKLVPRYHNAALGTLQVLTKDELTFDFGEWKSAVATRKNDDGTTSFVTTTPGVDGFDFVVGERQLVLRDAQHEYVFREKK